MSSETKTPIIAVHCKQQEEVELLGADGDGLPRSQHRQRSEEGGEHDQPDRDAVDAHVVVDVGAGDPGSVDFKLKTRLSGDKVGGQVQSEAERRQHDQQREPLDRLPRARQQAPRPPRQRRGAG